jgi:hypothetical protein
MMEQDYLDMVNQLKEKYDMITTKLEKIELMELDMKKDLMSAYGVVRMLDHLISTSMVPYDNEIMVIVEVLRGMLSDMMDRHILNIENGN